jgi:hypothetical protein
VLIDIFFWPHSITIKIIIVDDIDQPAYFYAYFT